MSKSPFAKMTSDRTPYISTADQVTHQQRDLNTIGNWALKTNRVMTTFQWWLVGVTVWIVALTLYVGSR